MTSDGDGVGTTHPSIRATTPTVPAFCGLLIGSSSDKKAATLPNGASAAYRAVM
jgi:hypothetical protein